ncbi:MULTISPECIES: phospholipase D-like domain-containing protein [Acinetobacter]|jgi:putative cardiolipin synthase|uniref:Phospholipase D family protein n=1 Tax=Acinetobacter chengduensis TaxID=2420890 RepID=A0ABX9TT00_9GAMM|nr:MULTISPECIES: phospholipase D family protein [Acinetobacter]MBI1451335.1 phospholipase D family protein [Acinetobacter sp. FL51]RKG38354.1 phospholipase D family protein [Acinetobacter sp. WCHAc060007]RLL19487.1 phospholipase D family protein [Acinetobacter chengduensis]
MTNAQPKAQHLATSQTSRPTTRTAVLLSVSLCLGIPACTTLPKQIQQPVEYGFSIPTEQTTLGKIITPLRDANPGLTGYHVLYDPLEALAARLELINKAEKTLDLQYYIWDNDKIGSMALHSIIQAADRGVKVRLLIDDNNSKKMEGIYLALDQHTNIDVKLYNPYRFRHYRAMDMLLDLKRINRRMHNKSFIADNQIALIGGRNMSNQYYNVSDNYQFSDVDVMLVGSASDEIVHSFDEYWNDDYAFPVKQLVNARHYTLRFPDLKQQLEKHDQEVTVQNYLNLATRSHAFENWLNNSIQLDWVKAEVVKDSPSKIKAKAKKEEHLNFQLLNHLERPNQSVDIVSAYFVPEKKGAKQLGELATNGTKVRILTNSFKANDVPVVHAFYAKYREDLLKNDVQLYEFLANPNIENLNSNTDELAKKAKVSIKGLSRSSLHAKLMALDEKQVFIGSFNFDPRSAYLNTEIGVLLYSPQLAKAVHQTMDENLSKFAYKLVLDANQNINWKIKLANEKTRIYKKEPRMKWWQRAGMKMIAWLPIEGFM